MTQDVSTEGSLWANLYDDSICLFASLMRDKKCCYSPQLFNSRWRQQIANRPLLPKLPLQMDRMRPF